ncbi:MAG: glycoside-pentoside-hexuronide (GPH):cation symporter [Bacilli bacterium]|jgi:melibiose permease/lactose/raffinose/galactose permease|nr:glycoside-pentoside-hexuronide (GPH):cation symporter [Bacilli bacterium]MDY0064093.1 glycoside-pentoside-hexuronide (GPH):cation symporter [Bacilli bacterium]
MDNQKVSARTKYSYAVGGIGRDMAYTLVSMFLLTFFTDAIGISNVEIAGITIVLTIMNIWDAVNDPLMGAIIDNTRTKWGKFKPWVLIGSITSGIVIFLLFQDYGLRGTNFIFLFTVLYLFFEATFTINDISYWSMYPAFTSNPKERESIGALARFFASLGGFIVAGLAAPIYQAEGVQPKTAFFWMALVIVLLYIACQILVVFGVKSKNIDNRGVTEAKTKWKDMFIKIFKNDQLMKIFVSFFLFEAAFALTIGLGLYFFNYDLILYGVGIYYTIFLGILAIGQLVSIGTYQIIAKFLSRRKIYFYSMILIAVGYALFMMVGYILPVSVIYIAIPGFLIFAGQGYIQVLLYVTIADTIEYGEWKLGTRNESAVYAIRPFATKFSSSFKQIIVGIVLIAANFNEGVINRLTTLKNSVGGENITAERAQNYIRAFFAASSNYELVRVNIRVAMMLVPAILVIGSYLIYRYWYKIDDRFYQQIIDDLLKRKEGNPS